MRGGGGGGNRILTRTVCSLLTTGYQLSVLSGIYQCLVRKQSVFLQFRFDIFLNESNFQFQSLSLLTSSKYERIYKIFSRTSEAKQESSICF